ncbi:MAG: ATP/GTP-binding protein, partial [bacterium]|nr:ATP/GTP-binding protein [bacterium]
MQYPASVAVTWQTTFDILSPPARTLLRLAANLAPEPIPSSIFADGAEFVAEALAGLCHELDCSQPEFALRDAMADLHTYSLSTRQAATFRVHRLVQEVVRSRVPEQHRHQWLEWALRLVNHSFPFDSDDVQTWPTCESLSPHAATLVEKADSAGIS